MNKRQKKKAYKKKHGHNPPKYWKQICTAFGILGKYFESMSRELEKTTYAFEQLRKAMERK